MGSNPGFLERGEIIVKEGQAQRRFVVAITGATGIIYAIRLLEALRKDASIETHLVLSNPAIQTLAYGTSWSLSEVRALADHSYPHHDIGASLASGSFPVEGMIIVPCSMHTLASVANGLGDNLILRAADVTLKERRSLICVVRETPFHEGHLQNMLALTRRGGIIAPPLPAFYHQPESIEDLVQHQVGRFLDLMKIPNILTPRWKEVSNDSFEDVSVDQSINSNEDL